MYSMSNNKTRGVTSGMFSSSQERIVDSAADDGMGVKSMATTVDDDGERSGERVKDGVISKTVEFQFHTTSA
jgi:hypothetical protein